MVLFGAVDLLGFFLSVLLPGASWKSVRIIFPKHCIFFKVVLVQFIVLTVGLEIFRSLLSGNLLHWASCRGSEGISSKHFLSFVASQQPVFE